ncbi:hypothetical protein Tco_0138162 [Tanacetum coccineum]
MDCRRFKGSNAWENECKRVRTVRQWIESNAQQVDWGVYYKLGTKDNGDLAPDCVLLTCLTGKAVQDLDIFHTSFVDSGVGQERSTRIPRAPERYDFHVNAEEHELEDHSESANYRDTLSDLESDE